MAYTRGNLAVKEKTAARGQNPHYRETTKVVTRRSTLPIREKLLYMVTILFCVGIMGGLLWQNSQLYGIKRQVFNLNTDIQNISVQVKELSIQKEKLEERIPEEAAKLGYVEPVDEGVHVQVPSSYATESKTPDVASVR